MFDQTSEYIVASGRINKDQHGGLRGHSTTTCLIELWEEAKNATEAKEKAAILAVDMSSAYDLCNHDILIEKCRLLNMGPDAIKFIQSFLKNRSQFVQLGGTKSETIATGPYGVVQGGKSSGELFLIYLNDLPLQLTKKASKNDPANSVGKEFVDDISILARAKTIPKLLKQLKSDYTKISEYLINHRMAINANKTQLMVLLPPKDKENLTITLEDNVIKHQDDIKVLGVTLSSNMKFDTHLCTGKKNVTQAINAKISLLKTLKPFISPKALALVGASLINSTILYAAPLWGSTTKTNLAKIQKAQTRAARVIKGRAWHRPKTKQHRQQLLDEMNWPNVEQIIKSSTANLT